jgi:Fuc2NAc and GlcNAc transferase
VNLSLWESLLIVTTAALAWWGTHWVIRHAAALGVLHPPNERSFHHDPVPHGGGLGLVLAFLLAVALLLLGGSIDGRLAGCILGAGGAVAALGLWDDIRPLPAHTRLAAQLCAVLLALLLLGGGMLPNSGPLAAGTAYAVSALLLLWWLNLFNFMDGIDGLAGIECLFLSAAAPFLLLAARGEPASIHGPQLLLLLLLAAMCGFLWLNWPPARVFLGDVGSTFVGYVLGVLALTTVVTGQLPLEVWLILGGVFWVDSTVTLLRRILNAEHWHMAHRSHAYQRYAAQLCRHYHSRGLSPTRARASAHRSTVLAVLGLNLLWLLPMAWLVIITPEWRILWLLMAWLPLIGLTLQSGRYDR